MAREKSGVAAFGPDDELRKELGSLWKIVNRLDRTMTSTMPQSDILDIDDPIEGEQVIDVADNHIHKWYSNNAWHAALGMLLGPWIVPTLISPWVSVYTGDCQFAYRWGPHLDASDSITIAGLQFRGAVAGGLSGSNLMTFPLADRFPCDKKISGIYFESSAGKAQASMIVSASSGIATVYFPV